MHEIKRNLRKTSAVYFIIRKLYHGFVFAVSTLAKFLNSIQTLNGHIIAELVFLTKPGNIFYKNYFADIIIIKKLKYKRSQLKVRINTYWDNYRTYDFETYPVDVLIEDIKANVENKKIIYYEIGANIGYSSLIISDLLGDMGLVYALEVEPTNFKTLCDNIILNKMDNITPLNIGISDHANISKFYYNIYHAKMHKSLPVSGMGAHSLNFNRDLHDEKVYCNVPLIPFDKLVSTFGLIDPTHVFIDTHGAELEVIESMSSLLSNDDLVKIMVDIEEENVSEVKETKIYKKLTEAGFHLSQCDTQIANGPFPNSYRSVFSKTRLTPKF